MTNCTAESCFFATEGTLDFGEVLENAELKWASIPDLLDPAAGELAPLRAKRKRQQLASLIAVVESEIKQLGTSNPVVVDFGAGSGHLGLLLAYRNPHITVILAERKEYSVKVANDRIAGSSLNNVSVFTEDIRNFNSIPFHMGVSLHSCGLLTDIIIRHCVNMQSSFVLVPCCYGQITRPPPFLDAEISSSERHRSRYLFQQLPPEVLNTISSAADYISILDDQSDPVDGEDILSEDTASLPVEFLMAKTCMRWIDFDRALKVLDSPDCKYICKLTSLSPLSCSPKNNVLVGRRI